MTDATARHNFRRVNDQCPVPQQAGLEKLRRLQNLVNQIVYQTVELDSGAA